MPEVEDVASTAPPEPSAQKRSWRPVIVTWCVALSAFLSVRLIDPRAIVPDLLVGPVDATGLQYLGFLTTAALVSAAIFVTAHRVGGDAAPTWRRVLASLLTLGVVAVLLLLAYPAFLIGALVFSSDYRTIGSVDGREVVVEQRIGLGQFPLDAGLRQGLSVDFSASTGDTWTDGGTALDQMHFDIQDGDDAVTITYRPGPRPEQPVGVLTVAK